MLKVSLREADLDLEKKVGVKTINHRSETGRSEGHPVSLHTDLDGVSWLGEAADVGKPPHLLVNPGQTLLHGTLKGTHIQGITWWPWAALLPHQLPPPTTARGP